MLISAVTRPTPKNQVCQEIEQGEKKSGKEEREKYYKICLGLSVTVCLYHRLCSLFLSITHTLTDFILS